MVNRYSRPVVAWVKRRPTADPIRSLCHLETEAGSGEFVCGYRLPPDVEVYRGGEAIDELDAFVPDCRTCADLSRFMGADLERAT